MHTMYNEIFRWHGTGSKVATKRSCVYVIAAFVECMCG